MKQILEQYFIEFGQLDLLSWGSLKYQIIESTEDGETLTMPVESLDYDSAASLPNKHFYSYLADALSISHEQAIIQFEQFIAQSFDSTNSNFELSSLGVFKMENDKIEWHSYFKSSQYFTDLEFHKQTNHTPDSEGKVQSKENWWIAATIILIVSLTAILFKIYQ
jgi:hypothetical protein